MSIDFQQNGLLISEWAKSEIGEHYTEIKIEHAPLPVRMHGASKATGRGLVTNGTIGADLIRLPAGAGFLPHTHPGHHVLIVIGGRGTITFEGKIYETHAGHSYLIAGAVPHAVGAITDHVIIAVGAPHKAVDADDRMMKVPYEEALVADGDLECLICKKYARFPARLHDVQCEHCPCHDCLGD